MARIVRPVSRCRLWRAHPTEEGGLCCPVDSRQGCWVVAMECPLRTKRRAEPRVLPRRTAGYLAATTSVYPRRECLDRFGSERNTDRRDPIQPGFIDSGSV